jgi:dienelactone hydrolase
VRFSNGGLFQNFEETGVNENGVNESDLNLLGTYGPWVAGVLSQTPCSLSFLHPAWYDVMAHKRTARDKLAELLAMPVFDRRPAVKVVSIREFDGLHLEQLQWQLPYGPVTEAVFMKPAGHDGQLPGILALHDHGGVKYFGKAKIIRTSKRVRPFVRTHQQDYYGNRAWTNEIAKRGYGVLVHDVFPFESRRVNPSDLPGHAVRRMMTPPLEVAEMKPEDLEERGRRFEYDADAEASQEAIERYNSFGEQHEHVIAKALFSSGFTWPGVFAAEDLFALRYLCARQDIAASRVGCCGLSGGGMRTNMLAGLDDRVKCSVTAGFMTTWLDFALYVNYTHTWMVYVPHLPRFLDYPEILGLHAPMPALVLATDRDPLFTLAEVRRAAHMLEAVYEKAGAKDGFRFSLYEGPHRFDVPMQEEAFDWLDRWLK